MEPIPLLLYIMTVCLSAQGIIVSVDRADYQPQQYSSMLGNGWRPVTGHDEININVSHTNKVQRFSAPLHPVIGKLQEHLGTSDKSKPQNRNRPPDFAPPAILGSFSIFSHATTKTREDPLSNLKLLPLETRKYSFLLPANRDHFHSQDPKFVNKVQKPDTRDTAPFYSNGLRYSSTASPLVSNRPFLYTYNVQQTLQPPDRPAGTFEYQTPNKQFFIPPGIEYAKDFGKNKSNQQYYNQHSHPQNFQPYNPDPNNFYNYNNHPPPYKVTYERNPGYLIHESHEVGYATPSFEMKFKPSYQNYVMPPGVYTSTLPSTEINYLQPRPDHVNNEQYLENVVPKLKNSPVNNEVLRKVRPEKNNQQFINSSQKPYVAQGEEDYVYVPPETQQYFRQKITPPVEQTTEKEYETPESISLKHYNDQLARLANQKNRQRIRDQELIKQQELQRQQYDEYSRQEEERRVFEKQQRLKIENEKTRGSTKAPIREEYQEYQVEQNREPQKVISGQRFPENQEKGVEVYELTVSQQPTVSYQSTTFPPPVYYQSTLSPQQQSYESSQDYWEQHVQYPEESFSSTKIPEPQRQSQRKQPNRGKPQSVSLYPELAPTEAMIPNSEVIETVTDIPIYTTTLPERTRAPTERTRNHRPSGKRRRRPTVALQDPRNSASKEKQEAVSERKPSRRRPEVGVRPYKNDLDVQTESPIPNQYEKRREEEVVYVTEYPTYYQKIPTESTESATETISFEYVTEPVQFSRINNHEYVTESTRPTRINNYDSTEPTRTHANNYEYAEPTRPSRIHNDEEQQKIEYIEATTPIITTSTTAKAPEVSTTASTVSTTKPIHRVRPSRFGNTSRPRFSVKEYKSRLDYKNKISQISTTEANSETTHVKQRPIMDYKKKQQTGEAPVRETTGKYKHVSRASYKTTSTTPSTEDLTNTTYITYTRNKINKFSPKQRPNNSYLYRSRTTSTTSRSIKQDENTPSTRPDNLYSSSIRHRPSIMRNRLKTSKEPSEPKDEIEMATEETSFYTHPTSQPESVENQVNEIIDESKVILPNDESNNEQKENSKVEETESTTVSEKSEVIDDSMKTESESTTINDLSTPDNKQSDEQLFEKASQSVADLTSSASALYNKPGLFKAVSPSTENRVVSSHLKITTGEPTLPIEAFFHNLSEKV